MSNVEFDVKTSLGTIFNNFDSIGSTTANSTVTTTDYNYVCLPSVNICDLKLNVNEKIINNIINDMINNIEKVIFHDSATIIIWGDGTKTVVKCNDLDEFSYEAGIAFAIVKKVLGNKSNYNNKIKKLIDNAMEY